MQWTSLKYHYDSEGTFALSGVLELKAMFFSSVHDPLPVMKTNLHQKCKGLVKK